jgi:DNA primase
MASIIETIKAKVDAVEEIGLVVALHKAGKAYKGLCPFHNERTPSFYVFADAQTWYCFGCHEGGDIFTFVQKQQGLEFREALHYLAEKAGIAVEEYAGPSAEVDRETSAARQRLLKMNEDALLWFHQALLHSKEAEGARAYVQSRGISMDSVVAFGIGYALEQRDSLTNYLLSQGYSEQELITGGLTREREDVEQEGRGGRVYDYFRNRLIFPIRDIRGRVIGFGGRALGDGKPKYLNSPQTLLFEKNSVLYALDMAKDAIKQAGQVIIVEGYVDAVIAHQYGTRQTVACIGSAITEKHIQQLKKLTRQVTLALDPDAAGNAATEHGIEEAMKGFDRTVVPVPLAGANAGGSKSRKSQTRGIIRLEEKVDAEINVLQLPAGEDPDEVIRRDFSTWLYQVSHPQPLIDYYFNTRTADLDLRRPSDRAEAARRLLPIIAMINERIKRDEYLRRLAALIRADERTLYEELQRVLKGQKAAGVTAEFSAPMTKTVTHSEKRADNTRDAKKEGGEADEPQLAARIDSLDRSKKDRVQWEDYLIGLLLQNPGLCLHVCGIINDGDFAGTDTRELYHLLNSVDQRDSSPSHQSFEQLVPVELREAASRARKRAESKTPKDGAALVKEAMQCASRLKRMNLLQLNTELKYLIQEAVEAGDKAQYSQHLQQMSLLQRQIRVLDASTHLQG